MDDDDQRTAHWLRLSTVLSEKIRELARQINDRHKEQHDERALDEVHEENRKLDEFKNRFLPNVGEGNGDVGSHGAGPGNRPGHGPTQWGTVPETIDYLVPDEGIHIAKGITTSVRRLVEASVKDTLGRPVRIPIDWFTSDAHIVADSRDGKLEAREKGTCEIWGRQEGR